VRPFDSGPVAAVEPALRSVRSTYHRLAAPRDSSPVRRRNFELVQLDSIAMGVIGAAGTFLPVFFVRLGAGPFAIGLLTTLPALGGLLFALPFGRLMERSGRVVAWYAIARLVATLGYAASAAVSMVVAPDLVVPVCLVVWALLALPQTIGQVSFPIVMDGAAGPLGRYDLLGRRWALMGLATAIAVALAGVVLDLVAMPVNYELVLVSGTVAGAVSYAFSSRITLDDRPRSTRSDPRPAGSSTLAAVRAHRGFLAYVTRKAVFVGGVRLVAPLLPLFYVRTLHASDAWIGLIAMAQALALVAGYIFWRRQSRKVSPRTVLLWSLAVSGAMPAALALTSSPEVVAVLSAIGAFFAAGSDLALFDEMMLRIPRDQAVMFSGLDYALVNLAGIIGPLTAALLVGFVGLEWALVAGAAVSLVGFLMFVRAGRADRAVDPAGGTMGGVTGTIPSGT
jgi:MFS family permease